MEIFFLLEYRPEILSGQMQMTYRVEAHFSGLREKPRGNPWPGSFGRIGKIAQSILTNIYGTSCAGPTRAGARDEQNSPQYVGES